ncbi:ABC-type transporter ATP-binding protein EcsA [Limihaloglobus sulfuriphilus]|uniref:ABC-type transporter ATP-binding protein EcsA n=1 Tax=Limihaloglobus sulfuriphilus TaxID=1851148 RepID=A0A1Q2MDC8_9BACT|nr:ABC transporter ATP-binding protein [Limihaloglobus sulfuriphilus]AQQ70703.1 ABC-type transporter ATP-binding protein EcsA [Limihaloglobus sulfuriphilus]
MSSEKFVTFENVAKKFGRTTALQLINMDISPGSIIGLIGSNGSGKSTLIRHIIGLYLPTYGLVKTFGVESEKLTPAQMSRIGYVHQEGQLLDWMSVRQHIAYIAAYYDHWNKALEQNYIEQFEIDLKARVGKLSPGKRQQLSILLAICHEPDLLLLDEPASALDPLARSRFLNLLLELIQDHGDRTILISSHILSDVEKVIDHVIVMHEGRILADSDFDVLRERFCRVTVTADPDTALPIPFGCVIESQSSNGRTNAILQNADIEALKRKLIENNLKFEISPLPLEEIYRLEITRNSGQNIRKAMQ